MFRYLWIGCLLWACACSHGAARPATEIVVIFQECPDHSSTDRGVGHSAVLPTTVFDYTDRTCGLQSYFPAMTGCDTLVIESHDGYAEVMHRNQAIENRYYLLMAGDTVLFTYGENRRPMIRSLCSERNTRLYTLPEHDARSIHRPTGYDLRTLCTSATFDVMWFALHNPRYRNDPRRGEQLARYRAKCPDLDSLRRILPLVEADFGRYVDSLERVGELPAVYAGFYRAQHRPKNAADLLHADSLFRFPSAHHAVQGWLYEKDSAEVVRFGRDTTLSKCARLAAVRYLLRLNEEDGRAVEPSALAACNVVYEELAGRPFAADDGDDGRLTEVRPETMTVEDCDGQRTTFDYLLCRSVGKVIYVDLWASWCGPCRAAMADAKKLRAEYADKEVLFVYLSVDNGREAWRRSAATLGITANSYRVLHAETCSFLKEIDNRTIPHYLLYDRQGMLVRNKAPHPNDPKIKALLNELLAR